MMQAALPLRFERKDWVVASISLAYAALALLGWHATRDARGLAPHLFVPLCMGGALLFFGALHVAKKLPIRALDRESVLVVVVSLGVLSVQFELARALHYSRYFGPAPGRGVAGLAPWFFAIAAAVVLRVLVPFFVAWIVLGKRPADYGFRLRGSFSLWWAYGIALALGLIGVAYASTSRAFIQNYPLCHPAINRGTLSLSLFVVYQLVYGILFFSGESFFRGFIVFGLARRLGYLAVFFMVIPYSLIHFGKPLPEALGAIGAGTVLGILALRGGSFWLGMLVHWSVALAMDLVAIHARGVHFV
jgi:membrane protease YdiL (CAAX protease family)